MVVRSPAEELARGARELGATLVRGNYRDQAVLRAAGVPSAGALVVTEDDDVGNLHAALAAQELNPALRMRLRMFNRELGRRVQELFEDCQVFDSAALAVPAFVSAALLQDWQQRVEVGGRTLVVRRAAAGDPGVLLPLARIHPDGTAELFPEGADEVLCLAEAPPAPARRSRHPERPALEQPGRVAAAWTVLLRADVRLRVMAVIVLGLTVTGIAIFWWFSGQELDLIDAIYFTVTIMTTTGFGDINLRDAPPALQLYGVALMLAGTAALAILFALITDALISARLARVLGANIPRGLHDHVVVCGLGNIGYRIVEQLHDLGVPVVAAELHETNRYLPAVRRLGVPVLVADIRLPETLEVLHVGRARSVVVVTSSDIVNLETALNIQALNPDIRVVQRLFDPDLAARVERAFGFHISRSPSALAAPSFAAAAAGEHVLATIAVGAEVLAVARLRVEPGCRAEGRTVAELEAAAGSRVLLLDGGPGPSWHPGGATRLAGGAELVVVVPRGQLGRILAWTETGARATRHLPPPPTDQERDAATAAGDDADADGDHDLGYQTGRTGSIGRTRCPTRRSGGPCIMGCAIPDGRTVRRCCSREDRVLGDLGVVDPQGGHRGGGEAALRAGRGPLRPAAARPAGRPGGPARLQRHPLRQRAAGLHRGRRRRPGHRARAPRPGPHGPHPHAAGRDRPDLLRGQLPRPARGARGRRRRGPLHPDGRRPAGHAVAPAGPAAALPPGLGAGGVVDAGPHHPRRRVRRLRGRRGQLVPAALDLRPRRDPPGQDGPDRLRHLVPGVVRREEPVGRRGVADGGHRRGDRAGTGAVGHHHRLRPAVPAAARRRGPGRAGRGRRRAVICSSTGSWPSSRTAGRWPRSAPGPSWARWPCWKGAAGRRPCGP